jgi:hypothetical protein
MADVFERNGARPARQPGRKIGQDFPGYMLKLGAQELRNATSPAPQPAVEPARVPPPQPERGR